MCMFELNLKRRDNLEMLRNESPEAFHEGQYFLKTLMNIDKELSMELIG